MRRLRSLRRGHCPRRQGQSLGLPIRTVLVRNLVTCRMYASLGQLIRGWSRILYDALDRKAWRLAIRLLDPLVFCQSGRVALGRDRHARRPALRDRSPGGCLVLSPCITP